MQCWIHVQLFAHVHLCASSQLRLENPQRIGLSYDGMALGCPGTAGLIIVLHNDLLDGEWGQRNC